MVGRETALKSDPWAEKDPYSVEKVSVIDPCALSAFTPVWRLRAMAFLTPHRNHTFPPHLPACKTANPSLSLCCNRLLKAESKKWQSWALSLHFPSAPRLSRLAQAVFVPQQVGTMSCHSGMWVFIFSTSYPFPGSSLECYGILLL